MLGLCGDVSDNIPGVPGIGPKTASKLILKYGNIETLLENTQDLKGKQKEQLEAFSEQARLSKQLATINQSVPIDYCWKDFELKEPDQASLESLFSELEFRTLGKRLLANVFKLSSNLKKISA